MEDNRIDKMYNEMIDQMTMEELKHWAKIGLITTVALFKKAVDSITKLIKGDENNGKQRS